MRDVPYSIRIGTIERAFADNLGKFVVLRSATLPNVCVGCGGPAWGNLFHKEYVLGGRSLYFLIFGKCYLLDFPFCATCPPDNFKLRLVRINDEFAIFRGVSGKFLQSLPPIPPYLLAQTNLNWLQRTFR
jgi:hypothetical protein